MTRLALLPALLAIIASSLLQILTDPRITRTFIKKSLAAFVVYAGHVAVGLFVLSNLLPLGPDTAGGTTLAMLGWVGLGGLGLVRFAPRLREPPAFLLHFGPADAVCLLAIGAGIVWGGGAFS